MSIKSSSQFDTFIFKTRGGIMKFEVSVHMFIGKLTICNSFFQTISDGETT